jgi:hypothetical protein
MLVVVIVSAVVDATLAVAVAAYPWSMPST